MIKKLNPYILIILFFSITLSLNSNTNSLINTGQLRIYHLIFAIIIIIACGIIFVVVTDKILHPTKKSKEKKVKNKNKEKK